MVQTIEKVVTPELLHLVQFIFGLLEASAGCESAEGLKPVAFGELIIKEASDGLKALWTARVASQTVITKAIQRQDGALANRADVAAQLLHAMYLFQLREEAGWASEHVGLRDGFEVVEVEN